MRRQRRKRLKPRSQSRFSCGHPRTPENTRVARGGYTWGKCRECDNAYMRGYMKERNRRAMIRAAVGQGRREALAELAKANVDPAKAVLQPKTGQVRLP